MRTRATTITLAAALLALTAACSSSSDHKPDSPATATATSAQPSTTPAPADAAALEQAVRTYTAVYFADKPKTAYGMLSARCKKKITPDAMAALTARAVGDYGKQDVKRFKVDQMSGDLARVSYGVGLPKFDQQAQPWAREGGDWKYDAC
ncbi:hypothetical protein [Streptomyces sp. NPDC001480]|uniref:hypothetical protein n=1 Tax=Streptomyces sp. NPDC001480 TaxID=3364577 RepID=UPI003680B3E1